MGDVTGGNYSNGTVILSDTYDRIYYCDGTYLNPSCEEYNNYTEKGNQTYVSVGEFSGVGGTDYSSNLVTTYTFARTGTMAGVAVFIGALGWYIYRKFWEKKELDIKGLIYMSILIILGLVAIKYLATLF